MGVQVGGTVTEMALGESHTCMLLESAEVACFGRNDAGQLGLGDTKDRGMAVGDVGETVDFGTGLSAVAVTSGCEHTCALLDDGSVKCFGENNFGQLGQVRRGGGAGAGGCRGKSEVGLFASGLVRWSPFFEQNAVCATTDPGGTTAAQGVLLYYYSTCVCVYRMSIFIFRSKR